MSASIVVCTHNQSPRLRLVLRALSIQSRAPKEVIVVDDASTDATSKLLEEAAAWFPRDVLRPLRLSANAGSPGARNAGARLARGCVLIFLDSDALPTRHHVELHLAAQAARGGAMVIGPLWHTTTTEFLADPARGIFFDVPLPAALRAELEADLDRLCITEDDVLQRFESIVARSAPGTYPHLAFQERIAEAAQPRIADHPAGWVLMTPQNFSAPRTAFEQVGGFDQTLPFAEGWDLVLSLSSRGVGFWREPAAPIYHLYHHHPFGDFGQGLRRWRAIRAIAEKHRRRSLLLALLFFRFHQGDALLPEELGPLDLDHLGRLFRREDDELGMYELILRGHPMFEELEAAALPKRPAEARACA